MGGKHTELPWSVEKGTDEHDDFYGVYHICHPKTTCDVTTVFSLEGGDAKANAQFIVKAVNNHDKLVSVVRGFLMYCELEVKEIPQEVIEAAYKALNNLEVNDD